MAKRSDRHNAWINGGLKEVGRATLRHFNRHVRPNRPRCGARTKTTEDGAPCRNLAMENGRCYLHGGKVPKGSGYHVHQWPDGNSANWRKKFDRKLKQIDRDKRRQEKRRADMTPEELKRYEEWQKTHRPGPAAKRAQIRQDRKIAAETRKLMSGNAGRKPSPEQAALQAEIDALERQLAELQNERLGVFG